MKLKVMYKPEGVFEEFPFLREIIARDFAGESQSAFEWAEKSITVKRIDENLLRMIPECVEYESSLGSRSRIERVSVVIGKILKYDVVKQATAIEDASPAFSFKNRQEKGNTVFSAVRGRHAPGSFSYLVISRRSICTFEGQEDDSYSITIYKPRDDTWDLIMRMTQEAWLKEQMKGGRK